MGPLIAAMVIMGVLIVFGVVLIGVELYRRQVDPDYARRLESRRPPSEGIEDAPVERGPVLLADMGLRLAPGQRIVDLTAVGSRLVVRVEAADGTQVLYLVGVGSRDRLVIQAIMSTDP